MRNSNKEDFKKEKELNQIYTLLEEIGVNPKDVSKDNESPDFIISLPNYGNIGIEVTQYGDGSLNKAEVAFKDVIQEYISLIDAQSDTRYHASVCPRGMRIAPDIKYKKVKQKIFQELDRYRQGLPPDYSYQNYIDDASFMEVDFLERSFIGLSGALWYKNIDKQKLLNRIQIKEKKLDNYRSKTASKDIKEFWLAIFFDFHDGIDIEDVKEPVNNIPGFERIYLCDISRCIRIR